MKVEAKFLLGIGLFFGLVFFLYWFTSYEDAGATMLMFTAFLGALPGGYLLWWSYHMRPRPEDRDDAHVEEGAGAVGSFPDSSIWPFVIGLGCALVSIAFVFGGWTALVGGILLIAAIFGVTLESRRGGTI